jgi:hypothetical protein
VRDSRPRVPIHTRCTDYVSARTGCQICGRGCGCMSLHGREYMQRWCTCSPTDTQHGIPRHTTRACSATVCMHVCAHSTTSQEKAQSDVPPTPIQRQLASGRVRGPPIYLQLQKTWTKFENWCVYLGCMLQSFDLENFAGICKTTTTTQHQPTNQFLQHTHTHTHTRHIVSTRPRTQGKHLFS